jgi:hypothetical protein
VRATLGQTAAAYGWADLVGSRLAAMRRGRLGRGFAGDLLRHGHCTECPLGAVGLSDEALPWHLCGRRLDALHDWTTGPLDQRELPPLTALRALDEGGLRRLGRLTRPLLHRPGNEALVGLSWDDALHLLQRRLAPGWAAWIADREVPLEGAAAVAALAEATGGVACAELDPAWASSSPLGREALLDADVIGVLGDAVSAAPVLAPLLAVARRRGARVWALAEERDPAWDRGSACIDEHLLPRRGALRDAQRAIGGDDADCGVAPGRLAALAAGLRGAERGVLLTDRDGPLLPWARAHGIAVLVVAGGVGAPGLHALDLGANPAAPPVAVAVGPAAVPDAPFRAHLGCFLSPAAVREGPEVLLLPTTSPAEQPGGATFVGLDGRARLGARIRGGPVEGPRAVPAIAHALGAALGAGLPADAVEVRAALAARWPGLDALQRPGDACAVPWPVGSPS